ncbi:unnamed protein product, partial [Caretta caretta]
SFHRENLRFRHPRRINPASLYIVYTMVLCKAPLSKQRGNWMEDAAPDATHAAHREPVFNQYKPSKAVPSLQYLRHHVNTTYGPPELTKMLALLEITGQKLLNFSRIQGQLEQLVSYKARGNKGIH